MDRPDMQKAREELPRRGCQSDYLVTIAAFLPGTIPVVTLAAIICSLDRARLLRVLACALLYALLAFLPLRFRRAFPVAVLRAHVVPTFAAIELGGHMAGAVAAIGSIARSALAYSLKGPPPGEDGKLRILMTGDSFYPRVDGVATFTSHAIKHCVEQGHEVHVMYSKAGPATIHGAEVTRLPGCVHSMSPEASVTLPVLHKVHLAVFRFRPHLVHLFESGCIFNLFMTWYCWFLDVPTVMSHHTRVDLYFPYFVPMFPHWTSHLGLRIVFRLLFQLNTLNITTAHGYRLLLWTWVPTGLPPQVWSTGVDPDVFSPDNFRQSVREVLTNQSPDLPVILHVGRLTAEKQSEEIPLVFQRTFERLHGKVRFAIIGSGPQSEKVIGQLRESLPLYCPGFLHGNDLSQAYASADVFFSPSTHEGLPLVYLEAMMSGLCAVGPNAGGTADTFVHGEHGLLYAPHDLDDAVEKLVEVVNNRRRYSQNVRQHALQYTWRKSMSELMGWYGDVCKAWGIPVTGLAKETAE